MSRVKKVKYKIKTQSKRIMDIRHHDINMRLARNSRLQNKANKKIKAGPTNFNVNTIKNNRVTLDLVCSLALLTFTQCLFAHWMRERRPWGLVGVLGLASKQGILAFLADINACGAELVCFR